MSSNAWAERVLVVFGGEARVWALEGRRQEDGAGR